MNTANLQLEGLLVAVTSLLDVMRRKDLLTQQEIDEALDAAEAVVTGDGKRPELSAAHVEAIRFPIRFLRLATRSSADMPLSFTQVAAMVGETKSDRGTGEDPC
ncbi:MAG: hypothetical protein AB7Q01_12115 [Gammaproteobacteria bacterium]